MKKYTKEKIELATLKGELLGVLSGFKLYIDNEYSLLYLEELKQKVKDLKLNTTDELYSIEDYLNFTKDVEVFKNELSEKEKVYWETIGVEVLWKRIYISEFKKSMDFKTHDDLLDYLFFELKEDVFILNQLLV